MYFKKILSYQHEILKKEMICRG